jgi:hypothetical protein
MRSRDYFRNHDCRVNPLEVRPFSRNETSKLARSTKILKISFFFLTTHNNLQLNACAGGANFSGTLRRTLSPRAHHTSELHARHPRRYVALSTLRRSLKKSS